MTDRSAVDVISGYFYQFDLSILLLLQQAEKTNTIQVECIEDIDIKTATDVTAVQCKYFAKSEYNHSVIKDAVMYMLSHFKEVQEGKRQRISYFIYGHYSAGQEKIDGGISLEFLKSNFLTYTKARVKQFHHIELGLDDSQLNEFLSLLTINIKAPSLEVQFQEILTLLQNQFQCSAFTAEFFYYNNCLRLIKELSTRQNENDRIIDLGSFLNKIDTSNVLFNEWLIKKRGKSRHLAELRKAYFTFNNISPFERFFLVEIASETTRNELKSFIFSLVRKWSKTSEREPNPFCPYLLIYGLSNQDLTGLKEELTDESFHFIDGYAFAGASFRPQFIAQTATHANKLKLKFLNSIDDLEKSISFITKTKELYQFYIEKVYFQTANTSLKQVQIQIEHFSDIEGII